MWILVPVVALFVPNYPRRVLFLLHRTYFYISSHLTTTGVRHLFVRRVSREKISVLWLGHHHIGVWCFGFHTRQWCARGAAFRAKHHSRSAASTRFASLLLRVRQS